MTKEEMLEFVRGLTEAVLSELEADINKDKVPDTWDGHELRWLLADRFRRATLKTEKTDKVRWREYVEAKLEFNL